MTFGFHCLYVQRVALFHVGQFLDVTEVYTIESIPELMKLTAEPASARSVRSGYSSAIES